MGYEAFLAVYGFLKEGSSKDSNYMSRTFSGG